MSTNKITRNRVEEIFSEVRYKTVSVKLWLIQEKVPLRELIETQTKSKDHDDRVLACRNVRNSVTLRLEDSTRNKTQKNRRKSPVAVVSSRLPPGYRPYRQALLAGQPQLVSSFIAAAVLSLRWIVLSSRLPLRPLAGDRSSSRLPSTTIKTLRCRCPDFRPIFSRLSASSSRLPGPSAAYYDRFPTKKNRTRIASRVVRLSFRECRRLGRWFRVSRSSRLCFCGWKVDFLGWEEKRSISRGTLPGVLGWGIQAQGKRPPGSVNQLGQYWKQKQNP